MGFYQIITHNWNKVLVAIDKATNWNHELQGKAYIVLAMIAGLVGVAMSWLMRTELRSPGIGTFPIIAKLLSRKSSSHLEEAKHLYNVTITAHGLIMIFYMLMPMLISGLGSLTLPRLLKTDSLAFPKIGYMSFWIFATSLGVALSSLVTLGAHSDRGVATG